MNVEISEKPLRWGELDVALFGVAKDWYGEALKQPVAFGFAVDQDYLWFVAAHQQAALVHPLARPGQFQPELWKFDVAEFFIVNPETGRYLEFNLAPNGAWWSAFFTAPRVRENEQDTELEGVATYAELAPDGGWTTAAAIPLHVLKNELNFGDATKMNATFIVNSDDQKFLTAADLGNGEPNFHQPDKFKKVTFFKQ